MAAMRRAMEMAGAGPDDIDYVNAHSTSTPVGDAAEIAALRSLFPSRGKDLSVTSTKSATGHLLGAAGAIEAVYSVMAIREGIVPPGLNIVDPEPDADVFDLAPNAANERPVTRVLSNGFGFGGVNAALVFARAG
jgi:3-oxoacyl-[acyl-carrier-protein] synthase II